MPRSTSPSIPVGMLMLAAALAGTIACGSNKLQSGHVQDEAMRANRTAASMPAADEDYFHDMDGGLALTREEVMGRNMWLVWTGGNDRFWDTISRHQLRHARLPQDGLVAPGDAKYRTAATTGGSTSASSTSPASEGRPGPIPNRYGLWLDVRDPALPARPVRQRDEVPGRRRSARAARRCPSARTTASQPGSSGCACSRTRTSTRRRGRTGTRSATTATRATTSRGISSGRTASACRARSATSARIRSSRRPIPRTRAGRTSSSNVGAQYFWVDRIFNWQGDDNDDELLLPAVPHVRPGTLDTSLVSTDNINNPRTMNAVYQLGPRMGLAKKWGKETLAGGGLNNRQFNEFVPPSDPLAQFFQAPTTTWTPRVLKDGSDSVGALGALNRVYINIGMFSEEWLLHFRPLIGGTPISPIEIAVARKNSAYWDATELQTPYMARFFLKSTAPHHLKDAPGGSRLSDRGRGDARRRARWCSPSGARAATRARLPPLPAGLDLENCNGKDYLGCWDQYWAWTKTDEFKNQMRADRRSPTTSSTDNYLSTELRVPVTLLQTNVCSPIATNAIARQHLGQLLVAVLQGAAVGRHDEGPESVHRRRVPTSRCPAAAAASRGRPRSSAPGPRRRSCRTTRVGPFDPSPSVEARMRVFQDVDRADALAGTAREGHDLRATRPAPGVGNIDRTTAPSYIWVPAGYIPDGLRNRCSASASGCSRCCSANGEVTIGPIPEGHAGQPAGERRPHGRRPAARTSGSSTSEAARSTCSIRAKHDLKDGTNIFENQEIIGRDARRSASAPTSSSTRATTSARTCMADEPGLSDADKRALIAFLKTF